MLHQKWAVWLASTLHIAWAALILVDVAATDATPVHILLVVFYNQFVVAGILTVTALLPLYIRFRPPDYGYILCLVPQQTVLLISAFGSAVAAATGTYADGVLRPQAFILADQMLPILVASFYTLTIFETAEEVWKSMRSRLLPHS